ncbi:DUF605-domain-containing protein [Xylariomycetidae sp. FL2044]|nr:DUF605-domain-containing protein [Xylariomycetidae sp. FL2044]
MAANIPAKLKQAGVTPFVLRANQLATAKPVISYWCQYWVVNQILSKQLHSADQECLEFTTNLMDKLEQTKVEQAGNDAILDDVAGQAYVEQFAQETFERALRPLKANKVTQQTASTFEAAATFFQLVNIWGQPDQETLDKIKYAKWNAARIVKAVKEGRDPNESNPKQEEAKQEDEVPSLDPNDPEVQLLGASQPRPASVEEVADEGERLQPTSSAYPGSQHIQVSAPTSPLPPSAPAPDQVSPIAPPEPSAAGPGSYFPQAPSHNEDPLDLPSTLSMPAPGSAPQASAPDPDVVIPSPSTREPSFDSSTPFSPPDAASTPSQDFYRQGPSQPPASAPIPPIVPQQPRVPHHPPPAPSQNYYAQPTPPPVQYSQPPPPQSATQYGSGGAAPTGPYTTDDLAVAKAQKHAKWAISALNFEDVSTAVRELQAALSTLGAR